LSVTLVYCGQTVGWTKMKLGMELGLVPDHILLDGDSAPLAPKRTTAATLFSAHVYCGQTAGWIKMQLGTEVGVDPGHIVLMVIQLRLKRGTASPTFRPMSIVAKRLDGSRCHLVQR